VANVPGVDELLLEVLKENIEWAKREKRTFLRQRLELKIAEWYSSITSTINTFFFVSSHLK
jgi:26S proteasome regulatory subunit N6